MYLVPIAIVLSAMITAAATAIVQTRVHRGNRMANGLGHEIRTDVRAIKSDVGGIKVDVAGIKADIRDHNQRLDRLEGEPDE